MAELLVGGSLAALAGSGGLSAGAAALASGAAGVASTVTAGSALAGGFGTLAAAGAGTGLSSLLLTILGGVATAGSALGSLQAADTEAFQATSNAVQADLEAGQSQLDTAQRGTTMRRELAKVLGENDVATAASGIDLGAGGIAETTRAAAKKQTADQLSIDRTDDEMRRALLKARANGYRAQASSYRTAGLLKAAGDVAGFATDVLQRG